MTPTPNPIDWSELITDLRRTAHGRWRLHEIAKHAGCSRATIIAYREREATPKYEVGARLISLWCEQTGRVQSQAPRRALESAVVQTESVSFLTKSCS